MVGSPSEILKRGYSDSEVKDLYAFGRYLFSVGRYNDARLVFEALAEIVPGYVPAFLGLCATAMQLALYDQAITAAKSAFRQSPDSPLVLLFLIASLISTGDYSAAGTYLGELNDKIENGQISDRKLIQFYRAQLARYRSGIKQ